MLFIFTLRNNLKQRNMKNLILIFATVFTSLTVLSQTSLNHAIPTTENVEQISVFGDAVYFSTPTGVFSYDYVSAGTELPTLVRNGAVNDMYSYKSVGNDTLCINRTSSEYYYGKSDGVHSSGGIVSTNIPVTALASNGSSVFAMTTSGPDNVLIQVTGTSSTSNPNIADFQSELSGTFDLEYFQMGGVNYIAILSIGNPYMFVYNLDNGDYFNTDLIDVTSATYANNTLYVSVGDEILSVDSFTDVVPEYKEANVTSQFTTNGATINEFGFNNSGLRLSVATNDGVYTNPGEFGQTASIDEVSAFDGVNLYPNPNNGTFTIDNLGDGTEVKVLTTSGQVIYSSVAYQTENVNLDMGLPSGIYFVQLVNGSTQKMIKFIKQ